MYTNPFLRVEVKVLNLSVLEEAGQSNSVVGEMLLFSDYNHIVLSPLHIELHNLLTMAID